MTTPTRERILDAAWELFLRQGFAGTTVTQVEAASGLSAGSGSFYRHFDSKDDVFRAAIDREVDRLDAARNLGTDLAAADGDAHVVLSDELRHRLENIRQMQSLMVLVQREYAHLGESRSRLKRLLVEQNLTLRSQRLRSWMDAGSVPERDADALAATILCALVGYQLSVTFFDQQPGGLDDETLVATLVDLIFGS